MCLAWIHWTFMLSYRTVTTRHKFVRLPRQTFFFLEENKEENLYLKKNPFEEKKQKYLYAKEFMRWIADFQESVEWTHSIQVNWSLFYFNFMTCWWKKQISWEFFLTFCDFCYLSFSFICWLKCVLKITVWRIDETAAFDLVSLFCLHTFEF